MKLLKSLGSIELKYNYPLKNLTSFKIGGNASLFITAHSERSLSHVLKTIKAHNVPYYLLGAGSNLLINDTGVKYPVIKLGFEFTYIKRVGKLSVDVGAATSLGELLHYCIKYNLEGLERFAGMPAMIGGMAVANASSFGRDFFSFMEGVEGFDKDGEKVALSKKDIAYGYRYTSLRQIVVTKVRLALEEGIKVREHIKDFLKKREQHQEIRLPTAGCIFKNPPGMCAGKLIDECNLKGLSKGDACISLKHANFIINKGKATAKDVSYLIELIKERVMKKFGISLEEEIEKW